MTVTRKIYLLTVLLIIITLLVSICWHIYEIWNNMITKEYEVTGSITQLLEQELGGKTYLQLVDGVDPSDEDAIKWALNEALQPIVEKVGQSFNGYGMGYYVKALNSIVAFVPDFQPEGLKDIRPQSLARTVYQTKEPYKFYNYSQTRDAYVIATIHPVIVEGEVVGHVWGNITVHDFRTLFYERLYPTLLIFGLMLVVALIGTRFITRQYVSSIEVFRDRVRNLDLDHRESPQFLPEMMEIYEEVQAAHDRLATSEKRFRDVVSAFDEYVWESDCAGRYTYLSEPVERILGYRPLELLDKPLHAGIHPDDRSYVEQVIEESFKENRGFQQLQYRRCTKDGRWIWLQNSAVLRKDEGGNHLGFRGAARDITEEKENKETIYRLAYTDILTQLPNRSMMHQVLDTWIEEAEQRGGKFALLFIDMDRFKTINDSLGHDVGDQVLVAVAQRLRQALAPEDQLFRLGGDEFIALFPDAEGLEQIQAKVERLLVSFAEPLLVGKRTLYTSVSIGVSLYPQDGRDRVTLIRNGDAAMYQAKSKGRNQYRMYTQALNQKAIQLLRLENDLRQALERKEFLLHYQPQVDLTSQKIVAVEALLRWQHPELGFIPPDQFIPLAEETGMILSLGDWVLQEACEQMMRWRDQGIEDLIVGVNISAVQFQQLNFVQRVAEILRKTGLPPKQLELELTERVAMEQIEHTLDTMLELQKLGVRITIDDFGTGYSSLNYLRKFPISRLKIDRMFIQQLNLNQDDRAIVNSIIALAHTLNLEVVAEGVEEMEQWGYLQAQACDYIQGYLISRPVPAQTLQRLLKEEVPLFKALPGNGGNQDEREGEE